ncbi:cell division protein FtsK [Rhizocola hellebori]|uniref:Cell division protein FtsK n=1 Tax=Rhizocola hellebori TaxID=1392758 RepID=A0A8J3VET6_9ACTN|nr:FtsK/SpoIIIE domain-containing protein [Rhizocola hellebori]GIH03865.1 cell division protein FtsK [Rhizocola hellebori]
MIPLVLRWRAVEAEVRLAILDEAATLDDLVVAAIGRPSPGPVTIDGRALLPRTPLALAGVGCGCTITLDPPATDPVPATVTGGPVGLTATSPAAGPAAALPPVAGATAVGLATGGQGPRMQERRQAGVARLELRQVAGYGAGTRIGLEPGRHLVRRAGSAGQPGAVAAVLEVTANGTVTVAPLNPAVRIDGIACAPGDPLPRGAALELAGADAFTVVTPTPVAGRRLPDVTGVRTLNRPPRLAPPPCPEPVSMPQEPQRPGKRRPLPWLSIVIPLPIAVIMAFLLKQPYFLIFGLMSPLMLVARFAEERRTRRKDERQHTAQLARLLGELREAVRAQQFRWRDNQRAVHADLAELVRRAEEHDSRLWERRPGDHDFLRVRLGQAAQPWQADVLRAGQAVDGAEAALDQLSTVDAAPLVADLTEGGLGFCGEREAVLPLVRAALIDLLVQHGPADLRLVVLTEPDRLADWDWVKWLPHAGVDGSTQLACEETRARAILPTAALTKDARLPISLIVVDSDSYLDKRTSPVRPLLARAAEHVRAVVITENLTALPAVCTSMVEVGAGQSAYHEPGRRLTLEQVAYAGLPLPATVVCARALAGLDDPDRPSGSSGLPTALGLLTLLEGGTSVAKRWRAAVPAASLSVPLGVSELGNFKVDIVADGPHALIAGTTGSGKSELLRTMVAALAATASPAHLNFVLIDYKGGGAFDVCADLPHTVGVVTDLDEHLGERALRCLKAEVRQRERLLRDAGAAKLEEFRGDRPLPRLIVIIDEFATLAAELPDFLQSLVDIAQRGRSLGVHLVLATQRPAGVLDNKIRANTNLRIALRVQEDADSTDVIGARDAARLPRGLPGRGYARLGAGELTLFQSAIVSAQLPRGDRRPVQVLPFTATGDARPTAMPGPAEGTDLQILVTACRQAFTELGLPEPRVPWPPPLPQHLAAEQLHLGTGAIPLGLADLPDQQRQDCYGWDPAKEGNLACYGIVGAGTSTTLATVALAAATIHPPRDFHLYVLDCDSGTLSPLAALPHTGAYIRLDEEERLRRLVRHLQTQLEHRRELSRRGDRAAQPLLCLLIDNFGALRQAAEDNVELNACFGDLTQIIRDGSGLGVVVALSAKQERALPGSLAAVIPKRLVMRLGDTLAYAAFGLRPRDVPEMVTGRAIDLATGAEVQVARHGGGDLTAAVTRIAAAAAPGGAPERILALPNQIQLAGIGDATQSANGTWRVPLGLEAGSLRPAVLTLHAGEAATVVGPSRSGRSTVLCTIARSVHAADPRLALHALAVRPSPLRELEFLADLATSPAEAEAWAERVLKDDNARWAFIDDAERLAGKAFEALAKHRDDRLTVVVAGRPDDLRGFGHWAKDLQRSRAGMALRPAAGDAEVFKVGFPVRIPRFPPGRGFLVSDGELATVQVAMA